MNQSTDTKYCTKLINNFLEVNFPRLGTGDAYPLPGAPRHISPGARVPSLGHRERREGQTGGEIPSAHANHRVEK
jgi:hypothetical protein